MTSTERGRTHEKERCFPRYGCRQDNEYTHRSSSRPRPDIRPSAAGANHSFFSSCCLHAMLSAVNSWFVYKQISAAIVMAFSATSRALRPYRSRPRSSERKCAHQVVFPFGSPNHNLISKRKCAASSLSVAAAAAATHAPIPMCWEINSSLMPAPLDRQGRPRAASQSCRGPATP